MAARDKFHTAVKQALIKEQCSITHDPLNLKFGEYDQVQTDLGAERVLAAEKDGEKIAAEELLERGVNREDIIFGLKPAFIREYTGFGVA